MPTVRSSGLLRDIAASPSATDTFPQRDRFRREALDLIERENLIDAAYCYRIVALDEPPNKCVRAGGETLDAMRLVPQSGQLTAVAAAICTLGPALEQRTTALFTERRHSLALALDGLGNELLFALSRRLQDRIVVEARKHQLTAAGELRPGDPGLSLKAQPAVLRLADAGVDRRERDAGPASAPAQIDVDGARHRRGLASGPLVALRRLPVGVEMQDVRPPR